jgi:hypothetical protein
VGFCGILEMYRLGNTPFGKIWEKGLAVQRDFSDGEPGLSRRWWLLWQQKFDHMTDEAYVREKVRSISNEASAAIGRFTPE